MTKEVKAFKCKVLSPFYIHFKCYTKEEAKAMTLLYFSDRDEVQVPVVEEIDIDDVDPEILFGAEILPTYTVN